MKVILITSPEPVVQETETIQTLFEGGLDALHVRKPDWSDEKLARFLKDIPEKYAEKIALHGNDKIEMANQFGLGGIHHRSNDAAHFRGWGGRRSRSTHSFDEINKYRENYGYYFLSPVFDSISKSGYLGNFDLKELTSFLSQKRVFEIIGLGGIDASNAAECSEMGFDGVALMGAIWKKECLSERIEEFEKIVQSVKPKAEV